MYSEADSAKALAIVTDYFNREDDRLVGALREVFYPKLLAPFVERWKHDARPWARAQILEYLRQPLNVPGHQLIVKRLYKQAEAAGDRQLVAAFLVAFDRLTRRKRATRFRQTFDPVTRRSTWSDREILLADSNSIASMSRFDEKSRKQVQYQWYRPHLHKSQRLFSIATRQYLVRRAWRFLRFRGHDPATYTADMAFALRRYVDEDLAKPENLLDCRGLMRICFGEHPALDFSKPYVSVRPGHTLAELTAAPTFEALWQEKSEAGQLWELLLEAPARTVRVWAKQMLERCHRNMLDDMPVGMLFRLLDHDDGELQQFGATLLEKVPGVDAWPLETWLRLLELRDPTALAIVCEQLSRRVAGSRLDVAQTLKLATARAVPVARIGFAFLRTRKWDSADDRRALVGLGGVRCDAVAGELAKWALGIIGAGDRYERDVVLALCDSLSEPMRAAAMTWFAGAAEAQDDPVLWSRLIESPYEEIRLQLVEQLQYRAARPRVDRDGLVGLWSSVLLGVHRGGRHKLKAVEQLVAAIIDHPEHAEKLVPVLGTAVRSIRGPEQRAGLAGAARLVALRPETIELLSKELPELAFVNTATQATG